jgi:hypothetical protein
MTASQGETPTLQQGAPSAAADADADAGTDMRVDPEAAVEGNEPRADAARHHVSAWEELDTIVPLRPRPVYLASWAAAERPAAATVLGLLGLIALLMMRPLSWAGLGGEQTMPGIATFPRSYLVFVPVAMAVCSWLLTRLLIRLRHWSRYLGIAGLTTFAIDAGARVHIEASTLIGHGPLPPEALKAVYGLAFLGALSELLAFAAGILAARAGRRKARWTRFAPGLMGAAFLLPLIAYLESLHLSPTITSRLVAPDPSLGVSASVSSTLADAIFEPYVLLIYMGAALAAWQAVTFAQAISEAGPRAARLVHRAIGSRPLLRRSRVALVAFTLLAAAKLVFDIAGYGHWLPAVLGGDAAIWSHGQSPYVWYYTCLVAVLAAVLLFGRLRHGHARMSLTAPLVILATLFALLGPIQILAETLTDFDPALGIHPPAGQALFVSPQLVSEIALAASGLALVYYWSRHPPAAALFGISILIAAPGVIAGALAAQPLVPGIGRFDLVISAAMLAWCLIYLLRIDSRPPPPWLIALWLGLTILAHFTTLIPDHTQTTLFVVGALLPLAYSLLWAGSGLNELARRHPAQATLALCSMATLLLIVAVQVWIGDRFGRQFNAFVNASSIYQEGGHQQIGLPLLVLLCWRTFARPLGKQTASNG